MIRIFVLFLVLLPVVSGGTLSTEVTSVGSEGTTFEASWSQGCLAETRDIGGRTIALEGTGPNSCDNNYPWYCPVDSDGTLGEWESDCTVCGCGFLAECVESSGTCQACQDPCNNPNTCEPGYICDSTEPSSLNSCDYSHTCIPQEYRVAFGARDWTWACTWDWEEISTRLWVWQTYSRTIEWGGFLNPCPNSLDFELSWSESSTGRIVPECTISNHWNSLDYCEIADWQVEEKCWWSAGGSATDVRVGSGADTLTTDCSGPFGVTHGSQLSIREAGSGYECRQHSSYGAAGGVDYYLNGKECTTSWS